MAQGSYPGSYYAADVLSAPVNGKVTVRFDSLRDARGVRDTSPPPPLAPLKTVTFDEKVEKLTCYYRLNEEQISYAEHERKARERGATVASIGSAEENEAVVRVARGQFCFIGALRIGGCSVQKVQGDASGRQPRHERLLCDCCLGEG